jgi:hypothetical protein
VKDTGVPPDSNKLAQVALLLTLAGVAAWIAIVVIFIL